MLTTTAIFTNPIEAHIVRGRLEVEGIPAFVVHEYHIWANWFLSYALGGVKVQVDTRFTHDATAVFQALNNNEFEQALKDNQGPIEALTCPNCNSVSIKESRWNEKIALLVLWAFVIPIPYRQGTVKCLNCRSTWVSRQRQSYPWSVKFIAIYIMALIFMLSSEGLYHICKIKALNPQCL